MLEQAYAVCGILRIGMEVLHAMHAEFLARRRGDDGVNLLPSLVLFSAIAFKESARAPVHTNNICLLKTAVLGNLWRLLQIHADAAPATRSEGFAPTPAPAEQIKQNSHRWADW